MCMRKLCESKLCEAKLRVDKLWEHKRREREREEAEAGYRTKNKNPTQRCGNNILCFISIYVCILAYVHTY